MNIDKTKYRINTQTPVINRRQNQPNFTSSITLPPKNNAIIMSDAIKDYIPSAVKGMKKLSDNMGEVQNIIINALGTGLVAPIFIKWVIARGPKVIFIRNNAPVPRILAGDNQTAFRMLVL